MARLNFTLRFAMVTVTANSQVLKSATSTSLDLFRIQIFNEAHASESNSKWNHIFTANVNVESEGVKYRDSAVTANSYPNWP